MELIRTNLGINKELNYATTYNDVKCKPSGTYYPFFKKVFDIFASLIALTLLSPAFLIISLLIKLTSNGKIFYSQVRMGKSSVPFKIYKFRTMLENSDRLEDFLTKEQLVIYKKDFKIAKDPRITKVGDFLRKTCLDEIPQFVNVLFGTMSLVGPRPIMEEELNYYGDKKDVLLSINPGITGYWQSYSASQAKYETNERQSMELYYVNNYSMLFDIKIIMKTIERIIKYFSLK